MRWPLSKEDRVFTPILDFSATSACESPDRLRSSRSLRTISISVHLLSVGLVGRKNYFLAGFFGRRTDFAAIDGFGVSLASTALRLASSIAAFATFTKSTPA